ncbi:hypothetical protein [Methylobacter sp. S3L5C]|uniref:hypothetical protein n=1 Tax=Methylobacter sp. S3L5C TaxID=2839024 RepID=UPI001FADB494|nr:hypothetical protein [Methylobacter sp. S3L5C]UOA07923.1 hypothetical protein KKZ03_16990 [Methylobacter sp. S3L5C]
MNDCMDAGTRAPIVGSLRDAGAVAETRRVRRRTGVFHCQVDNLKLKRDEAWKSMSRILKVIDVFKRTGWGLQSSTDIVL